MKRLFLVSIFFMLAWQPVNTGYSDAPAAEKLFFKANRLYFDGKFEDALEIYENILSRFNLNSFFVSKTCGELFYNIGNCYYRSGQKGRAILNYERAKLFLPRDADLKYNLEYLKDEVKDDIKPKANMVADTFFWIKLFTSQEVIWGFIIINILFFAVLTLRFFYKTEWNFYLSVLLLIVWLIGFASLGVKLYRYRYDSRVIIVEKEVAVLAGPDAEDTLLFKLHEGAMVSFERKEYNFAMIHLPDGKRGWLPATSIEFIVQRPSNN